MTHHNFDSRNADKFVVRLPDGLRAQVDSVAVAQSTSMNSIFIRSVQQFLDGQNRQELLLDALADAAKARVNQISEIGENVNQLQNELQNLPKIIPGSLITENPVAAETPYALVRVTNIDEWIRTVQSAKRYEWLRDVAWDTPRQDLALRDRHQNMLIEQDLDSEIDCAMHAYPGEREVEPCAE